jgi:outer membrane receptor protein involved in Fe transport
MYLLPSPSPVALAAVLACVAVHAATAQTAPAAPATADDKKAAPETVVITATKRETPAYRVPINVTAIGEEQLREENITDLKKLIASSPAIDAPGNSARFADSVTVRGLNISSVSANNIEWFVRSTLSYYLDDAPLPNIGYRIKDIARVETLLGPQGTLYGGGSLGGTVRYVTNQPVFGKTEGRLSTSFYQTRNGGLSNDIDGVINLPIGTDFALRIVAARLDEKGYTDRFAGVPDYLRRTAATWTPWTPNPNPGQTLYEDDDWQKVDTSRVSARWRLTPDLELTLAHAQQSQLAHGTSGAQLLPASGNPDRYLAPPAFNDRTVLSPYEEFADRDFRMTSFDLDWKLPFGRLHSSTSSYKDTRAGQADYLGTGWFFYGNLGYSRYRVDRDNFTGKTAYFLFDNAYKGTVHETRITSNPGGRLDWIAGYYHASQKRALKYTENLDTLPVSGAPGVGYLELQASDYTENALFGELSYKLTPKLTLTAGARAFSYRDEVTTQVEDLAFDLVTGTITGTEKGSAKSYFKLNAAYQIDADLMAYFTASQGFRRGGANGFRDRSAMISPDLLAYQPDSTDNFELGLKGYFLARRLYLQANVYRINWKNTQTYFSQDIDGFPVWGTANGPDATSTGFDLDGRFNVADGWQLRFGSTRNTAKFSGTRTVCLYADGTECRTWEKGAVLGGTPTWKHTLGLRWDGSTAGGLGLNASLRARYTGKKPSDRGDAPGDAIFEYEAYTTLSANVGVSRGNWDLNLWVDNLTDERTLVSFQGTSAVGSRTGLRAIYLVPRTIGLNASYRF